MKLFFSYFHSNENSTHTFVICNKFCSILKSGFIDSHSRLALFVFQTTFYISLIKDEFPLITESLENTFFRNFFIFIFLWKTSSSLNKRMRSRKNTIWIYLASFKIHEKINKKCRTPFNTFSPTKRWSIVFPEATLVTESILNAD